jgi:hypothetical protein
MNIKQRIIAAAITALMGAGVTMAQQIAVVSSGKATKMYQTLQKAIEGALPGSVIYLPGGGFQIPDSVKIAKKLSIVGIGHKANSENADGNTVISGNLFFNGGSNGASVMGCYISGTVYVGNDGAAVHNIVVKYCNLGAMNVKSNACTGTVVNQCYVRNSSNFGGASALYTNNVSASVGSLNGGMVTNNVFTGSSSFSNCSISRNIFLGGQSTSGNSSSGNINGGEAPVNIGNVTWADLFVNYNNGAITPASDFQIKETYRSLCKDCGIYGGTGFRKNGQPPMPFFMAKSVPGQTDADENLVIQVKVKAGE